MNNDTPTIDLGEYCAIIELGFGTAMRGQITGFDEDFVGLVFRLLPDELVMPDSESGDDITDDLAERLCRDHGLPTLFMRAKNPGALRSMANSANFLADLWDEYLAVDRPEDSS